MKTNYSDILSNANEALLNTFGRKTISDETIECIVKSVIDDVDQSERLSALENINQVLGINNDSLRADLAQERIHRTNAYRLQNLLRIAHRTQVTIAKNACIVGNECFDESDTLLAIDAAIAEFQAQCHPHTPQGDPDSIHLHICANCGAIV